MRRHARHVHTRGGDAGRAGRQYGPSRSRPMTCRRRPAAAKGSDYERRKPAMARRAGTLLRHRAGRHGARPSAARVLEPIRATFAARRRRRRERDTRQPAGSRAPPEASGRRGRRNTASWLAGRRLRDTPYPGDVFAATTARHRRRRRWRGMPRRHRDFCAPPGFCGPDAAIRRWHASRHRVRPGEAAAAHRVPPCENRGGNLKPSAMGAQTEQMMTGHRSTARRAFVTVAGRMQSASGR